MTQHNPSDDDCGPSAGATQSAERQDLAGDQSAECAKECGCGQRVDDHLKAYNTQLLSDLFGPYRAFIETIKADSKKRGKPMKMFATYCPFCGVKYPKKKSVFDHQEGK